jgi:two-component system cell cycle response regulator
LEAGADDFLTKPVSDVSLFCRVKSLVRLKMLTDELRTRTEGSEAALLLAPEKQNQDKRPGRILIIDNRQAVAERIRSALSGRHEVSIAEDEDRAVGIATGQEVPFELIIVNLDMENVDALRICSQLKSLEKTRQTPILIIVDPDDHQRLLRALDLGVNDYLIRPIDKQELLARVNTQIRRCRYAEQLRVSVQTSLEMAVTDALTGLYNRRYMETQLGHLVTHSVNRGKPLAVLAVDVDFFKPVNDTHGHDAGDRVLQELAARMRASVRNIDMVCRTGGEEFIAVLPATDLRVAEKIAERMRKAISAKPFNAGVSAAINITVSIGIAALEGAEGSIEELLKRADQALYRAKRDGRNRVVLAAA